MRRFLVNFASGFVPTIPGSAVSDFARQRDWNLASLDAVEKENLCCCAPDGTSCEQAAQIQKVSAEVEMSGHTSSMVLNNP